MPFFSFIVQSKNLEVAWFWDMRGLNVWSGGGAPERCIKQCYLHYIARIGSDGACVCKLVYLLPSYWANLSFLHFSNIIFSVYRVVPNKSGILLDHFVWSACSIGSENF